MAYISVLMFFLLFLGDWKWIDKIVAFFLSLIRALQSWLRKFLG